MDKREEGTRQVGPILPNPADIKRAWDLVVITANVLAQRALRGAPPPPLPPPPPPPVGTPQEIAAAGDAAHMYLGQLVNWATMVASETPTPAPTPTPTPTQSVPGGNGPDSLPGGNRGAVVWGEDYERLMSLPRGTASVVFPGPDCATREAIAAAIFGVDLLRKGDIGDMERTILDDMRKILVGVRGY